MQARNIVGLSAYSQSVQILAAQIPDAPTNLANDVQNTKSDRIGLTWSAPSFNGGSAILDYKIWYDNAKGGSFSVLAESAFGTSYIATGLI